MSNFGKKNKTESQYRMKPQVSFDKNGRLSYRKSGTQRPAALPGIGKNPNILLFCCLSSSMMMLVAKIGVTVVVVLGLSLVAEHVSTRLAGMLSGYPLGAAIVLFFYGVEQGPAYAAKSAVYTLAGLVATEVFVLVYFLVSRRVVQFSQAISSAGAIAGFLAASWLLQHLPLTRGEAAALTIGSVPVFVWLFRSIENSRIRGTPRLKPRDMAFRALLAAGIVVSITACARLVGTTWAGLFSAFPTTLFPLIVIVHLSHDRRHVHTIIKNFPLGLGSLIIYTLVVTVSYPRWGVILGTAAAFAAATLYLAAWGLVWQRK
jgi:uncharacterized membrane protein (GlpM family)